MTEAQAAATQFCARVIGPYYIVMAATLLTRQNTLDLLLPAFMQDSPLPADALLGGLGAEADSLLAEVAARLGP